MMSKVDVNGPTAHPIWKVEILICKPIPSLVDLYELFHSHIRSSKRLQTEYTHECKKALCHPFGAQYKQLESHKPTIDNNLQKTWD